MPSRDELADLVSEPSRYVRSDDPVLRRMAVTALSSSQAFGAFADLERLAVDDDPTIRAAVAEKLGLCGAIAVPVLAERQDDPDERVREATATAYGGIFSSRVPVPPRSLVEETGVPRWDQFSENISFPKPWPRWVLPRLVRWLPSALEKT